MVRRRIRYPVYVIKFKNVPKDWKLSDLTTGLKSRVKSIIYVHRVADYKKQSLDEAVYMGIHDMVEYEALKLMTQIPINGQDIYMDFEEWKLASAEIAEEELANEAHELPTVLLLSSLKEVLKITTIYINALLKRLDELNDTIVGIAILYDTAKFKSRPFGFVSFLNRATAASHINTTITVDLLPIHITSATTIPVVVSNANQELIAVKPVRWTPELKMANWLVTDVEDELLEPPGIPQDGAQTEAREEAPTGPQEGAQTGPHDESDHESVLSLDLDFDYNAFIM